MALTGGAFVKRPWFLLFLFFLILPALACGGAEAPSSGVKIPATATRDIALEQMIVVWEEERATATSVAATIAAMPSPTLAPPSTPTPGPLTHKVVDGETPIHVMGYVSGPMNGNCNWAETMLINGITDPNLILIDQVIVYPSDCHWVDQPVP